MTLSPFTKHGPATWSIEDAWSTAAVKFFLAATRANGELVHRFHIKIDATAVGEVNVPEIYVQLILRG